MIMVSFRNKKEKEHLLEKARKMEEYASMIVDCIEDSYSEDEEYEQRAYRADVVSPVEGRYGYRRRMR